MANSYQLHVSRRERCLVSGYIREVEKHKLKKVIPYAINMMCIDYYHSIKLLYHFSHGLRDCFHVADLDLNTSYIYNITPLTTTHNTQQTDIVWNAAMCKQKNFEIPQLINQQMKTLNHDLFSSSTHNQCDVIFKCGGSDTQFTSTKYCTAFILSPIVPSSSEQIALQWELPAYPQSIECHVVVYSANHGLLSVGGFTKGSERLFYRLRLDEFGTESEWESMPSTKDKRSWTSCICVDDDKLFAIGGYNVNVGAINTVEMFDFVDNEWRGDYKSARYIKNIKHKRYRNGIYYDKEDERIYISGGRWATRCTEWYDFSKNKWFDDMPPFKCNMDHYPVLWKEQKHILYVASHAANCMQWIDLRENRKWNVVYRKVKQNTGRNICSLEQKFGIQFQTHDANHNRLLL